MWKKNHPDRYINRVNPHVCPQIAEALKPLIDQGEEIDMNKLCALAGIKLGSLVITEGFGGNDKNEDIICAAYVAGECTFNKCKRAHIHCNECPQGYAAKFRNRIVPGVAKWMAGERPPAR